MSGNRPSGTSKRPAAPIQSGYSSPMVFYPLGDKSTGASASARRPSASSANTRTTDVSNSVRATRSPLTDVSQPGRVDPVSNPRPSTSGYTIPRTTSSGTSSQRTSTGGNNINSRNSNSGSTRNSPIPVNASKNDKTASKDAKSKGRGPVYRRNEKLEEENHRYYKKNKLLKKQMKDRDQEVADLQRANDRMRKEIRELKGQQSSVNVNGLQSELDTVQKKLEEKEKEMSDMNNEMMLVKTRLANSEAQGKIWRSRNLSLEEEVQRLKASEVPRLDQREQVEQLEQQLEEIHTSYLQEQRDRKLAEQKVKKLEKEKEKLKTENYQHKYYKTQSGAVEGEHSRDLDQRDNDNKELLKVIKDAAVVLDQNMDKSAQQREELRAKKRKIEEQSRIDSGEVECHICHRFFARSGIQRHMTVAHPQNLVERQNHQ